MYTQCSVHELHGRQHLLLEGKADQRIHLERVKRERLYYVMHQRLAALYPTQYLNLIIDGRGFMTSWLTPVNDEIKKSGTGPETFLTEDINLLQ